MSKTSNKFIETDMSFISFVKPKKKPLPRPKLKPKGPKK